MSQPDQNPTIQDVLIAINKFADDLQIQLQTEFDKMVTKTYLKDYIDNKLYELKGDLIVLTRKEDRKLVALVELLRQRQVINQTDANSIIQLEPFGSNI